ncbi:spore germination protein [Natroniella sulfidigena]|uniref:spore germination protein n=1 Tax=Natroniella sulfidigena TaxID=723921 RepID=UPI00200B8B50|nr:spore germination protein [Natroniella sulfidigena]MCK8816710.1 spore germination protein [Natroniella sulfidigena]
MWDKIKDFFKSNNFINRLDLEAEEKVSSNLEANIDYLKDNLAPSSDLVFRSFHIGQKKEIDAEIIYFNELINADILQKEVLRSLMFDLELDCSNRTIKKEINDTLINSTIPIGELETTQSLTKALEQLLSGDVILFIEGIPKTFILGIKELEKREVQTPQIEAVTRGPQESFIEPLSTNISLIRRRIKDNNLMIDIKQIGERTKTDLAIIYIDDIVDQDIIKKVRDRLESIEIDGVLEIGYINQSFRDNWASPFPQFQTTERPDKALANLLEGKVVLLLDGSPFASIMPTTFIQFLQSPEDYYDHFYIASLLRLFRVAATFITISLPAIYISLVSFHHELLPRELALSLATAREGVPFPSVLEAFIMEISLEFLREAGIRLPGPIGQTIGIVGGLILGEAAVDAGLVSPPMVIVVALTAIASFVIPSYSATIPLRLLRFSMMLLAAVFSTYGLMIGWLLILIHLCSLESLGVPYFAPFAPIKLTDLKDSFIKFPLKFMGKRPESTPTQQKKRQPDKE